MNSIEDALIVAAVLAFGLAAECWQIRRAHLREVQRDRIIREAHARAATAREVDDLELLYSLPAYDRAWDAGRERLWDAIRDNENHHKGDQ